jgi:gamma-glutamyltranspeptidase/glutathione hydrolase
VIDVPAIHPVRLKKSRRAGSFVAVILLIVASGCSASLTIKSSTPGASAVASAHPLATRAGREILEAGGNAFDAAVAVTAALAVVEPTGSGLGGGGFFLLHRAADNHQVMIDGREKAPRAAHRDMYLDENGDVVERASWDGPLAAGIPGIPAAIAHLARRYGSLSLEQTLAPAIRYAREGFTVDARYQAMAQWRQEALRASPAAAAIFLHNGKVPGDGFVIKQPDLADTLAALQQLGSAGFYEGEVAQRLVNGVRDSGGIWSLEDLRQYNIVERQPVTGQYGDIRITAAAPPSSGGIALVEMLNILAGYDLERLDAVTRTHVIVEAMRRAYRDRADYLGDPDFVTVPAEKLTHPLYAAGLAAGIRLDRATPSALLPGTDTTAAGADTTHFSILDRDGNRVAATLSINLPFGSGFVAPGTGVLLNDEMDDFSMKAGVPNAYGLVGDAANAIAPGKRPLSSMTPTFLETPQRVAILGTPGGSRIITMVLLATLDFADGTPPQSWVSRGRYHHQFLPDAILHEPDALPEDLLTGLQALGHATKIRNRRYGNMQAILWKKDRNEVSAASDPRGIGEAWVSPSRQGTD